MPIFGFLVFTVQNLLQSKFGRILPNFAKFYRILWNSTGSLGSNFFGTIKFWNVACSSTIPAKEGTGEGTEALHRSTSKGRHHDEEASPDKHRHGVTHLASSEARLEEPPDLTQQDDDGRWSRPLLWEHLSSSTPLAIADNRVGWASGWTTGKGDSRLNLQRTEEARWTIQHIVVYIAETKPKRSFGTHDRESVWWARRFDFLAHLGHATSHSPQMGTSPTCQQQQLNRCSRTARKASHYSEKRTRFLFHQRSRTNRPSTQHDSVRGTQIR
jgi:hypothetical protein